MGRSNKRVFRAIPTISNTAVGTRLPQLYQVLRGYKYEAKDCVKCPVGYTSAGSSSTSCTKCGPGTSNKQPGSKNCYDLCKAGNWSSDGFDKPLNTVGCAPCSKGYYSDVYGAKSCTQCPNGLSTVTEGAKTAQECVDVDEGSGQV
ncbi:predicted protein [Nematostella vectensis]|uniref:Tyrosine-protein kinase ephrin type A/B receptor-like domain-containing protein n=1 Tax=Nematostella vectensis TaxID=45351 RepID=A7SNM9_NEMVE|nr:predicted protein [Nematostella vectensis]|eukprot:XP_001626784.1 predicted protein [Nematostella vectensis]